ncbi:cytochrome P450 [Mycena olivaceomarginata]|nr:cytochrome P450 [Mycena olivaceomarginata]
MQRRVVSKDGFRFSDGTVLPHGAFMSIPSRAVHYDTSNYENAATFDGFRFERERVEHMAQHEPRDQDIFKRHMISVAPDHLPFGTGKHACPGRFFAATELKAMLAHLVINYDVKAEVEGVRPPDLVFKIFDRAKSYWKGVLLEEAVNLCVVYPRCQPPLRRPTNRHV